MEILGIGLQEILFILVIALIVLGPKDMQKTGRALGRWLNRFIRSDTWKVFQRTSTELRNLPSNLMREANLEDLKDVGKDLKDTAVELQDLGKKLQGTTTELQEVDKEIRQTIDPRPRPPASSTSQISSNEPDANNAASADTPAQDQKTLPPSSEQTKAAPQPSSMNPTDVNGSTEHND